MEKYDKDGYDVRGFNAEGIHKDTGTKRDLQGFGRTGYNKEGYDRRGFSRRGIHKITRGFFDLEGYDREGYDREGYDKHGYDKKGFGIDGYDKQGYDRDGFDKQGIHKITGTRFGINGKDREGYNKRGFRGKIHKATKGIYDPEGYDRYGYDIQGYNREGYDKRGFDKQGIHKITGTRFDIDGRDKDGYDVEGYNSKGYDRNGFDINGYNRVGFDRDGYNRRGYNRQGVHKITGTLFDLDGFDRWGVDKEGYNRDGYNEEGFARDGYNKQGYGRDGYNRSGYNRQGYDKNGFDIDGYDKQGYDREGVDRQGFDKQGINRETGTIYDKEGFDRQGFDKNGIHRDTKIKYDSEGYDRDGYNKHGYDRNGINKKDAYRIEFVKEFIASEKSIEKFAREKQMTSEEAKRLINEIRLSPEIKTQLEIALNRNINKYLGTINTIIQQLISGKKTIRDIRGIDKILSHCNSEERQKITEMLIKSMASHEISILEYRTILGIENIDANLPQNIIVQIEIMKKSAGRLSRELYREIDRIKPYKTPYNKAEGEKLGFLANPKDKEPTMFQITDKERDMARQYLRATGEFICNKTMQATLMKIVKGELDIEKIERAKKERELRSLQQEDAELSNLIEQSEQFIGASQEKATEVLSTGDSK